MGAGSDEDLGPFLHCESLRPRREKSYPVIVMIAYSDLEFAISRWKARAAGASQTAEPVESGMVESEVPVATAPEEAEAVPEAPPSEVPEV